MQTSPMKKLPQFMAEGIIYINLPTLKYIYGGVVTLTETNNRVIDNGIDTTIS